MLSGSQLPPSSGDRPRCRGCDHPRPAYTGGYTTVRSRLSTMLANAEHAGCDVCAILSEGILKFLGSEWSPLRREDADELLVDFNLAGSRRSVEVTFLQTSVKLSFFASEITPWLAENMPDLPLGNDVPSATWSDESTAWAVQQLEHCKRTHESCNSFPPAPLPSRVLDVLAHGGEGVRLYVSQGETAPYAALSHCWGRKPFLRTMSGSLEEHRNEIAWARLPRTFRDAVEFVRKLGIRYLWIDSLCIVQDDLDDWRREASRMASVYQNAAFVVSAAKAAGAYGGLYAELPPTHRPLTVRFKSGGPQERERQREQEEQQEQQREEEVVVHVRRVLSHPHRVPSPYNAPIPPLPIFTRAWIMQERFLCPRILHFGPEELSFECLESTACQCTAPVPSRDDDQEQQQQQPRPPPWYYRHLVDRVARPKHYYSLRHWQSPDTSADDLEACWRRLVEDYSRLRLSHDRDAFPAVSGLARQMQSVRGPGPGSGSPAARYVAGLWTDTLLRGDLAWSVHLPPLIPPRKDADPPQAGHDNDNNDNGNDNNNHDDDDDDYWAGVSWGPARVCRPRGWRAPSWSWASVRAPVRFADGHGHGHGHGRVEAAGWCEMVEVRCEPAGADPMGELREGGSWLVLRGRLVRTGMRFRGGGAAAENGELGRRLQQQQQQQQQPWDVMTLDILAEGGYLANVTLDDDCRGLVAADGALPPVYLLLIGRGKPGSAWFFLLLARVPEEEEAEDGYSEVRGRAAAGDGHVYRRLGLVEVSGGPPSLGQDKGVDSLLGRGEDAVVTIV
ncbi:hypothetical protein MYCTH_2313036 [Thermothelomyces thermophilus ATCC 42464]|uniref:Heterokaryon incompatibility domain-containing protein n=1 Tax=Thermothelomyces thermophilus (strain ATCC 42464 / BCRC 31852 / DSM 1799) TaxID=573729 RepID=G2QNL4_THET4|nr:uncharacterized protein MYCTH_2313036 [Thermothelomyces thermophilus ATCC 42464]AEO62087.1 hypothetical protein MYCTH_2313036 [Thermothelomyces thermophilus ATCC 42464]